jgi:hypothetical protein
MYINKKEIIQEYNLTESEFLTMTVAKILECESAIKNKKVTERRQDPVALERYKKFFRAYDQFVKIFGQELTDKYLVTVDFQKLVTTQLFRNGIPNFLKDQAEFIKSGTFEFEEFKGSYSRKVRDSGQEWLVPNQYQTLVHKDIIEGIMLELYPWTKDFKINYYTLEDDNSEFYVVVLDKEQSYHNSLYVKFKDFISKDIEAITKRNKEYLNWYCKDKGVAFNRLIEADLTKEFLKNLQ